MDKHEENCAVPCLTAAVAQLRAELSSLSDELMLLKMVIKVIQKDIAALKRLEDDGK